MRPIERIDNFIQKVNTIKMSNRWKLDTIWHINLLSMFISDTFIMYWKENYDMRVGQALINFGIIPDSFQTWNDEEYDILKDQGLPPEEYLFWGSIYDKDMNPIPLMYRLVKDMDTDHIEKVLSLYAEEKLTTEYITAFTNVLKSRNRNYSIGDFGHYHSFYTMNNTSNND
jgi:hypothetical protein